MVTSMALTILAFFDKLFDALGDVFSVVMLLETHHQGHQTVCRKMRALHCGEWRLVNGDGAERADRIKERRHD
jgi:hypothetical protein